MPALDLISSNNTWPAQPAGTVHCQDVGSEYYTVFGVRSCVTFCPGSFSGRGKNK